MSTPIYVSTNTETLHSCELFEQFFFRPKRAKKVSSSEKESEMEERLTEEQKTLKGEENMTSRDDKNLNNSLNSLSGGSSGKEDVQGKREAESPAIETIGKGETGTSEEIEKKSNKNSNERVAGENHLVANCKERTGASSPSPSVGQSTFPSLSIR